MNNPLELLLRRQKAAQGGRIRFGGGGTMGSEDRGYQGGGQGGMGNTKGGDGNKNSGSDPNKYNANREIVEQQQQKQQQQQQQQEEQKNKGLFDDFSFSDLFNENTFDNLYNKTGQLFTTFDPALNLGLKTLGMFNFNPKVDPETGEISQNVFGEDTPQGKLNIDNYGENPNDITQQDLNRAAFNFDEKGNFLGTDFDSLDNFTKENDMKLSDDYQNYKDNQARMMEEAKENTKGSPLKEKQAEEERLAAEALARAQSEANMFDDPGKLEMYKDYLQQGYPEDLARYLAEGLYGL